jgi:hypothetical protein
MSTKDDSILFGAKRAGVTYLYEFNSRSQLEKAQAAAKRLGISLAQLLNWEHRGKQKPTMPRIFTEADQKASVLKIQIIDCDDFTRRCLERQAAKSGRSVEEYIVHGAHFLLGVDESDAVLDPKNGEVVIYACNLGSYRGCNVDEDATELPPSNFTRIPIPSGTIVEQCA